VTTLTNSFEGGTSGTTVTAANSGGSSGNAFDSGAPGTGCTLAYDNAHPAHGGLSMQVAVGGTSAQASMTWAASLPAYTQIWFRAYVYLTALPTTVTRVILTAPAAGQCAYVQIGTTGKVTMLDSTGAQMAQLSQAVPTGASFRIEGWVTTSATAGQGSISRYDSMDSVTATQTATSGTTFNTNTGGTLVRFGQAASQTNVGPYWLDDVGASTDGPLGPVASAIQATAAIAGTGTAGAPGPGGFPSVLKCSGQGFVDGNGYPVPLMKGFNLQVPATAYSNQTFIDIAAKLGVTPTQPGLIRMVVYWDLIEPTQGNIDTGNYVPRLDLQVSQAVANGLYVYMDLHLLSNHFPSWASTVTTTPAHALVNYVANGQNVTTFLANRYGNPSSPQYTAGVMGFGINEPAPQSSDFGTAGIQVNIVAGQATAAQWVRNFAPQWIMGITGCYAGSAPIPNAAGSGQTTQIFTAVPANPLAAVNPPGNFMWDVHDEWMCTTLPGQPNFDARTTTDGTPNNATGVKLGLAPYTGYPPVVSGSTVPRATCQSQQVAWWAPYVAYCGPSYANCPILIGESGWNALVDTAGGQSAYLADKMPLWGSLAGAVRAAQLEWDYAVVQSSDGWAARPGVGAAGADSDGWQTWTNLFIGWTVLGAALPGAGAVTVAPIISVGAAIAGAGSAGIGRVTTSAVAGAGATAALPTIGITAAIAGTGVAGTAAIVGSTVAATAGLAGAGTATAATHIMARAAIAGTGTLRTIGALPPDVTIEPGPLTYAMTIGNTVSACNSTPGLTQSDGKLAAGCVLTMNIGPCVQDRSK
jgi:hypothetical protein